MRMSEPLEPRALRSGNVLVTDTNGLIALTGDAADNAIFVTQVKGGHLKIAGANGKANVVANAKINDPGSTPSPESYFRFDDKGLITRIEEYANVIPAGQDS